MSTIPAHVLTALAFTVAVGLVSGGTWPYFVMGGVLALALWVMLFAGSWSGPDGGGRRPGRTSARHYALAAAVALVLGYVMYVVGDGASWWAVGVIFAGILVPAGTSAARSRTGDGA
jgi:hypothetical protein